MGVTIAFCDRFKVEELGSLSGELRHDSAFEYVSRRSNVSFTSKRWRKSENAPAFAHIGEAVKGFLEGKEFGDVVKRAELLLGLRKPSPNVKLSSRTPAKGETIAVLVSLHPQRGFLEEITRLFRKDAQPEARVRVLYDGCEVPALPTASDSKMLRALVPTTPLTPPGPRAVKVFVGGEVFEGAVEVAEREYPVESIWLPKTKATIRGTVMEKEKVGAFLGTVSEEQMWSGPFTLPSDGEVTTGYGLQRYYNGVFADHDGEITIGYGFQRYYDGVFANHYYHRGVDYGAWEGDPVRAPAHGRVALVGKEKDGYEIHGNCVGLDHGHGVTSIMMHLNSSFVKEGEMVHAGQIIGTVGETGIATGPHLHWGLHVRGEAVDPQPWMQEQKWI